MCRSIKAALPVFILLSIVLPVSADPAFTLHGKVLEKGTRRPLEGISVYIIERDDESTMTGPDGIFSLPVEGPGEITIEAAGMGFLKSRPRKISLQTGKEPKEISFYLEPVFSMQEVVVTAERNQDRTAKTVVEGKELTSVPGSQGDPLRGMQALPGITTSNDFSSNPAIRGSGPQDNAYYVDFLPAGYLFHMGGLVSVFNADLVDDFNIYSSAFGPEFADVTGAIIDVRLRNPRQDRLGGKLNISMLEADALVEGPVSENQSFYLSARRSYLDLFLGNNMKADSGVTIRQFPQYYDYQGKYVWELSPGSTLDFEINGAKDEMKLTLTDEADAVKQDPILAGDMNFALFYHSQGAVLTSEISPRIHNKSGISHMYTTMEQQMSQLGHANIDIHSYYFRDNLDLLAGEDHDLLLGFDYDFSAIKLDLDAPKDTPSDFDPDTDYTSSDRFTNNERLNVNSWDLSLKDRWRIFDRLILIPGGRVAYEDYFNRYEYEPRLGLEYPLLKGTLLTAGWGKYHQFPQGFQVIDGAGNPHLDYIKAEHYDIGVEQKIAGGWSAKLEGYYKKLYNLVVPHQPENYVNGGSGKAYGSEFLLKKNRPGDWWGWLSMAYSRTERRNDLTGENFPYRYDQPLVVNIVFDWEFKPRWTFGAKWRYQSGAPFTPVTGTYTDSTGRVRPVYGDLGSERLPDYHRLDLRISRDFLFNTWKMGMYLDIINAYNHKNVAGYRYNADYSSREPVEQLPLMPSIGIHAEF